MLEITADLVSSAAANSDLSRSGTRQSRRQTGAADGLDRFVSSNQKIEFTQHLELSQVNFKMDINGRMDFRLHALDIEMQVKTDRTSVEYKGKSYEVGTFSLKLNITEVNAALTQTPFEESDDPITLALELVQSLSRIARLKGKKSISLLFKSKEVFAKLAGIDNGRFLLSVMALIDAIERTSEFVNRNDPQRTRYIVPVDDHAKSGLIRQLDFSVSSFSMNLTVQDQAIRSAPASVEALPAVSVRNPAEL